MAKKPPAAALSAEDRQRLLEDLAAQQAQQRTEQVSALVNLHEQIVSLRAQLAKTENTYRATYRQVIGAGLLTAAQLRTLGVPTLAPARPTTTKPASSTTKHTEPTAQRDTAPATNPETTASTEDDGH